MNTFFDNLENKKNTYIARSLKKMEEFLIDKEVAISASEIKKLPRIQIKGCASNGRERLLQEEIQDDFGIDTLENNNEYNTVYPIFNNGILMFSTKVGGTYYSHFNVISETEEYFDLEIKEYRLLNGVTYLNCIVFIEDVSKRLPASIGKVRYSGIKEFFVENFSKNDLSDFSNLDFESIEYAFLSDYNHYVDAVVSYTLTTFRAINFLKNLYLQGIKDDEKGSLYDNNYFCVKNFIFENETNNQKDLLNIKQDEYIQELLKENKCYKIIQNGNVEKIINAIISQKNIKTFYSAVGYAFASGLQMIENSIQILKNRFGECEFIIGALQNHAIPNAENKIDKKSVKHLNMLIQEKNIKLYTNTQNFYHGKFYYMSDDKKAFIIIGSSNISKTAFQNNYELDIIHIVDKDSEEDNVFLDWYYRLKDNCQLINLIDENNFEERNWASELDVFRSLKTKTLSINEVKQRINNISEEEKKFRLNLWLDKKPTEMYENIDIESFKEYIMFVFAENKLVVFESLLNNNAYYVFRYKNNLVELLTNIKCMSKTQMSLSEHYINKGYHIQYKDKIRNKIEQFFI